MSTLPMQSTQTPAHFRRVTPVRRVYDVGRIVGLSMYFCLACVLVAGSAVAFYRQMQPILNQNEDVSAHSSAALPVFQLNIGRVAEPSPVAERPVGNEAAVASAMESEGEARDAQDASKPTKSEDASVSSDTKRKRPAYPKRHDPRMDYAAQPSFFGDYRQWSNPHAWSGYRSSGSYQASGNYGSWNSYQGWGVPRNSQDTHHRKSQ
jgi:hypothetical protein